MASAEGASPIIGAASPGWLRIRRLLAPLLVLTLLCSVPFLVPSDRWMRIVLLIGIYVVLASGLNILVGYTGLLDLGYIAFFAIGAYTSGLITVRLFVDRVGPEAFATTYWWIPYANLAVGAAVAACLAGVLGYPTLRARGDYLAIMTLGLGEIVRLVAVNWEGLTRGPAGIPGIPSFALFGFEIFDPRWIYFVLLAVALISVLTIRRLVGSYLGRAWMTIREDQLVAQTVGVRVVRYKSYAYMIGGAFAGMVGVVFAHQQNFINPDSFVLNENFVVLAILILGGAGTLAGPIIGGIVYITFDQMLATTALAQAHPELRQIALGAIVLVILRFASGGIVRSLDSLLVRLMGLPATVARRGGRTPESATDAGEPTVQVQDVDPMLSLSAVAGHLDAHHRLDASSIDVVFGGLQALRGASITVDSGEVVGLIGPNGAGKTTLINVLSGVIRPASGSVRLDDEAVVFRSPADAAAKHLSRTFQTIRILSDMTVLENVLVGAHNHVRHGPLSALGLLRGHDSDVQIHDQAEALLRWVGLGNQTLEHAGNLPYGHQRRLEIARSLMTQPWFLFLDEPAAGMNPRETDDLKGLIAQIRETGIGIVLVEHDMRLLMSASDRVIVLNQGSPLAEGLPEEVAHDSAVIEAYLGSEDNENNGVSTEVTRRTASTVEPDDVVV